LPAAAWITGSGKGNRTRDTSAGHWCAGPTTSAANKLGLASLSHPVPAARGSAARNFTWLLVTRFILGIGIGGDYPISATIMTEYANRRSRGKQVAMMFSAYTAGQVLAFAVALTLLAAGIDHDLAWRLMLGIGALPALAMLYNRRRMPESPRFTASVVGDSRRAADDLNGLSPGTLSVLEGSASRPARISLREFFTSRRLMLTLLGTAGAWFMYDVAIYGNSISQPAIVNSIVAHPSPTEVTAINLIPADRRAHRLRRRAAGHRRDPGRDHEPGCVRGAVRAGLVRLRIRPEPHHDGVRRGVVPGQRAVHRPRSVRRYRQGRCLRRCPRCAADAGRRRPAGHRAGRGAVLPAGHPVHAAVEGTGRS
jgi:hypothetical protein